jgi:CubicO group peptidase (beta-lactamase class C family)
MNPRALSASTVQVLLVLLFLAMNPLAGQTGTGSCDWTSVENNVDALLDLRPTMNGVSMAAGASAYTSQIHHGGEFNDDTIISLASASKLISGLVILRLVDQGLIDLDAPVSNYLPEFTGDKGRMTMRQMFSHTAGLPGNRDGNFQSTPELWILNDDSLTLAESVDLIACCVDLIAPPGEKFSYGGFSMQVAGRVAEVVGNADWEALVERELSAPLDLTSIDFQGLGVTRNYRIGGAARSSLQDYRRILETLANGGVYRGQRLLSESSMSALLQDQMAGKPIIYGPPSTQELDLGYGFGGWLHFDDAGEVLAMSSKGAFDALPWFRPGAGDWGMIFVQNFGASLNEQVFSLFDQINAQLDDPDCRTPFQFTANAGLSGLWFDPAADAQGLVVDLIPERNQAFAGWLTWDLVTDTGSAVIGDADQRWFTLDGHLDGAVATMDIYTTRGGVFDAAAEVRSDIVGSARIEFHGCQTATLDYEIEPEGDSGEPLLGQIAFQRLTPDQFCQRELP